MKSEETRVEEILWLLRVTRQLCLFCVVTMHSEIAVIVRVRFCVGKWIMAVAEFCPPTVHFTPSCLALGALQVRCEGADGNAVISLTITAFLTTWSQNSRHPYPSGNGAFHAPPQSVWPP